MRTEARDLMQSRRALADQRREASPHAQLAHLYRVKRWSGRALASVVAGSMLFSAANVQHNLAPGGPTEPLYWMSYLLEALISTVLVVFMVSGSAVARWKVDEGEKTIQWTEAGLLAGSILLNTYPYLHRPVDWAGVAVHSVAPIMMGVALFGHTAVAKRMGAAIAKASLELSVTDDTAERLAELLDRARTTVTPAPQQAAEPIADDAVLADFEREFADTVARAEDTEELPSLAREPIVARATEAASDVARESVDRASLARDESQIPRAEFVEPRASEDTSPIASDTDIARADTAPDPDVVAREEAHEDRASRVAHSPAELGADREPIAAHEDDDVPVTREADEAAAREDTESLARDLSPVVTLVRPQPARATRETSPRSSRTNRSSAARETAVDGALARATDRASRATSRASDSAGSGPFARELTPAEATRLARAVHDRRKSKQPVEVLAKIYLAKSQGMSPNSIGDTLVDLPHSTVGRAIDAAIAISGPRALD
ncbi:hypothetical protein ACWEH3_33945 [Nocardia sp. NPDC004718]